LGWKFLKIILYLMKQEWKKYLLVYAFNPLSSNLPGNGFEAWKWKSHLATQKVKVTQWDSKVGNQEEPRFLMTTGAISEILDGYSLWSHCSLWKIALYLAKLLQSCFHSQR
jgi:hypothetical protein